MGDLGFFSAGFFLVFFFFFKQFGEEAIISPLCICGMFSALSWLWLHVFIFAFLIPLYWMMCLFLCKWHAFFYYYGSGTVWLKSVMVLHNLNILYFFLNNVFIVLGLLVYKVCSLFLRHLLHTQPNSSRNEK